MKREKQVLEKLELAVKEVEKLADSLTKEHRDGTKQLPEEVRDTLIFHLSFILAMGWVMDCEDEIREFVAKVQIASLGEKLKRVM